MQLSKWTRLGIAVAVALALALLLWKGVPRQIARATARQCLDAYVEAAKNGDVDGMLECLAEPLRSATARKLAERDTAARDLRAGMSDVRGWVQHEPEIEGTRATVVVDEIRPRTTRQMRFRLERWGRDWLITSSEPLKEAPPPIPFGTHVGQVPEP